MSRRIRTLIKLLFILAFFISAPFVVFTTAGYRYNWQKNRIEKTGILTVASSPTDAPLFLNDVLQPKTTPLSLQYLLPGEYHVRIKKNGFFEWKKTLGVKSGETTFVQDVTLLKDTLPHLLFSSDITTAAFTLDGRQIAFLRNNHEWKEIGIFTVGTNAMSLLGRFAKDKYTHEKLQWSPDGSALLFSAQTKKNTTTLLFYSAQEIEKRETLDQQFPEGLLTAHWSTNDARIVLQNAYTISIKETDGTLTRLPSLFPHLQDTLLNNKILYILKTDQKNENHVLLVKTSIDGNKEEQTLTTLPPGTYSFTESNDHYFLLANKQEGKIFLINQKNGNIEEVFNATHALWDDRYEQLLLWNDFEISVANPILKTQKLLTRLSTPITECAWHPKGTMIFYSTANEITTAELDDRDSRNITTLVKFTNINTLFVDRLHRTLRFVGSIGTQRGIYEKDL